MPTAPLDEYRRKRSADRTPEPVPPPGPPPQGNDDTFVVHEHHARRLHWDLRLERGGVLVSWAIPKGLPPDPKVNHLAVRTEDHPLEYAGFHGEIPKGEYGAGQVIIWDRGTYETEKWSDREVMFVLHGSQVSGRYVLFRTRDKDWMIHRMDPPPDPDWRPLPDRIAPMQPTARRALPPDQELYGFEFAWDGLRTAAHIAGGRLRLLDEDGRDVIERYPELRGLGARLGTRQMILDGELVTLDAGGRPSPERLSRRAHAESESQIRKLRRDMPVTYLLFDVLHLDGRPLLDLPYRDRRTLLDELALAGPHWQTTPWFDGDGGAVVAAARQQGLPGVVAKRLDAPYRPGRRSTTWLRVVPRTLG